MITRFVVSASLWACALPLTAQSVRTVPLDSIAMVYSQSRSRLYVAVLDASPQKARTVTIVNPLTGAIGASIPLEAEAWALAISQDERYLYAGLVGGNIVRIDLQSFTRDLTISTEATGLVDRVIIEIHPLPDRPTSFVASLAQHGFGALITALAAFDEGTMRPRILSSFPFTPEIARFTFGADSSTLWGYDNSNDAFQFYGLRLDSQGLSLLEGSRIGLVSAFHSKLLFREGLLYTSRGRVFDPVDGTIKGRYYSSEALFAQSFAVDWERDRIYFASRNGYEFFLAEFDVKTFRRVGDFQSDSGQARVPGAPYQTVFCGSVLAMGGYGPPDGFITLFPISLIRPAPQWQRPPQQPLNDEIRRIPLENNTIVYDANRNRILASTSNWVSTIGNSVVPIDPVRGRVGEAVWVGSDPWQMAVSDDGQYLYVGLYSGFAVQRVRLDSLTLDLLIPTFTEIDPIWGRAPVRVNEILPYPGRPESFVAVRAYWPGDPRDIVPYGVALYDQAAQRPAATDYLPYDGQVWSAQWASGDQSLYAFPNFRELQVNDLGVEVKSATKGVTDISFSTDQMRCQYDLCFTPRGDIIDATSQESLGRFAFNPYDNDFYPADFIVPDLDRGLVYFLSDLGKRTYGDRRLHVEAYELPSQQRIGHLIIEDAQPPTGFLIWGGDQLALSTSDELILFPMSKLHDRQLASPPTAADIRWPIRWVFPFVESEFQRFTGFAVSNPSADPMTLRLTAHHADGDPNILSNSRRQLDLRGRSQWSRLAKEVFEADALGNMWFELDSEKPWPGGFFLFQDDNGLDGATAQQTPSRVIYFPRVASGEHRFRGRTPRTELYLVNPNGYSLEVQLTVVSKLTGPSGLPEIYVRRRKLPAYGSFIWDATYRLPSVDFISAYVKAEVVDQERGGLIGFLMTRFEDEPKTVIASNAVIPSESTELYSAQLASGPGIFSNLKLVNTSDQARQVVLYAVDDDGSLLAEPVSLALEAGDSLDEDADALFGFPPSSVVSGSLRVEADGPGLIGNVLFGDPQKLEFASALNLESSPFLEAVFSHVANVDDFFTGLALYNTSEEAANVTLEVYSAEGRLTGSKSFILPSGSRLARLLTELVPASAGQAGGYVRLGSEQPLVGQQLFGDIKLTRLAAVPAQPIR